MNHSDRLHRLNELETQIQQQRLEIRATLQEWHKAAAPIDYSWRQLMRYRIPLYAVGGLATLSAICKPRATRRLFAKLLDGAVLTKRGITLYREFCARHE